ncbi:MAG: ATP-binding protein [Chloroflexota bacterium]
MDSKPPYTDSPHLHPNPLLGSLQLLFWLFFHPSAWQNYVVRLDPGLPPNFTLISLNRRRWRNSALRRLLIQGYLILPLLPALVVGLILWQQGIPFDRTLFVPVFYILAIDLAVSLMIGAVIGVAAGMAGGVLVGLAASAGASILIDPVEIFVIPTLIGLAIGAAGSVAATVQPTPTAGRASSGLQMQVGSVVIGLLVGVGVVTLVQLGLATLTGLAIGLSDDAAYWLSRAIVVGVSFGVALGWQHGRVAGIVGSILIGLIYGLVISGIQTEFFHRTGFLVDSGLVPGLASGLLFGTSFGVTVVLPFVLSNYIGGPWAGAWAAALGSWGRHVFRNEIPLWPALPLGLAGISLGLTQRWWRPLLLYPLVGAWNLVLYQLDRRRSRPLLLRYHAAFWDEFQRLPLRGLDDHLLWMLERNPDEGQAALAYLRTSRQRWSAQAVQIELEARRLEQLADLEAISQAHDHLIAGELDGPANVLLRNFSHLSRDIEAALNQTTVYHQRLALNAVDNQLNNLLRELMVSTSPHHLRFYPIATRWQQLVAGQLRRLVETAAAGRELDNPYIVGVPLTEQQEIFVGRADIVARIEQLLLDQRRPPLLLYGQRRMGKTSLLRNLGRLLPQTIAPLFVDGQRIALAGDLADLLYNLARQLARSAEQQRHLSLPSLDYEPLTARPFTAFNDWLDAVEQRLEAGAYQAALLALDEFELLEGGLVKGRFDETDLLSMLRHMIQHRTRFKVMLAGSHSLEELQRWASYLINVQVIKLGYLTEPEARQLIEQPIRNFDLRYEPAASRRVLELSRGHPALVQLLCCELVNLKNEQRRRSRENGPPLACREDVEAAVPRAMESGSFFFADIEQNQVDGDGLALLRFLAGQGAGAVVSRTDLAHCCGSNVDQTLRRLLQRELIEAVERGFRFQVELIRRWFADH